MSYKSQKLETMNHQSSASAPPASPSRNKFAKEASSSLFSMLCCSRASPSSQSFKHVSISTMSLVRDRRRSSITLPVRLKAYFELIVKVGTIITSFAKIDKIG
uniref:Uncharacterized protein n=1 Tax=Arundo donax TaxID=35708 RepID=A0A0A9CAY4_ARUDO